MSLTIGAHPRLPATDAVRQQPSSAVQVQAPHVDAYAGTAPPPVSDVKKHWRQLEWAAFGIEMVGGTLALLGSGPIGIALAAIGGAGIVFAGYERQHSK